MGKRIKLSNSSLNRQVDGGKTLAQAAHGSPGRPVFQSHIYHISHHTSLFFKFLARCLLYCSRCFCIVCSLIQSYSISNFVSFDHIRVTQFLEQISVFHTTVDDCNFKRPRRARVDHVLRTGICRRTFPLCLSGRPGDYSILNFLASCSFVFDFERQILH